MMFSELVTAFKKAPTQDGQVRETLVRAYLRRFIHNKWPGLFTDEEVSQIIPKALAKWGPTLSEVMVPQEAYEARFWCSLWEPK